MRKSEKKEGKKSPPVLLIVIGTFLGIGYLPLAPGTFASLFVCLLAWFAFPPLWYSVFVIVILFCLGVWSSAELESRWDEDDRRIVIDEAVGMLIALFAVPHKVLFFLIAFFLFRFFDIVKPYPLKKVQELEGGWGIVMDDVFAGMYSSIFLWIFIFIYHEFILV
jgi:phosphatidylglycerophosphatase A